MRYLSYFLILLILFSSCSVKTAKEKSLSNIKKISYGDSKESVKDKLGDPVKIDEYGNFLYTFCPDDEVKKDAFFHIGMNIATLGLWEPVGYLFEKNTTCRNRIDVVVIFKDDRVSGILEKTEYEVGILLLKTIALSLEKMKNEKNYALIHYNENIGWIYIYKNKIDCNYDSEYIKAYFFFVPSFSYALKKLLEIKDVPAYMTDVVLFDPEKERFLEIETKFFNLNGQLLQELKSKDWSEIYPDTFQEDLLQSLTYYCINKILNEYKNAPEKPEMKLPKPGNTSKGSI